MDFSQFGELVRTTDDSYTVRHPAHGECYHSYDGADKEAVDLYVDASGFGGDLMERPLSVADIGLGLGYNVKATVAAWLACKKPHDLEILSLEIDEKLVQALATGKAPWQKGWNLDVTGVFQSLQKQADKDAGIPDWADAVWGCKVFHPGSVGGSREKATLKWQVIVGDARKCERFPESSLVQGDEAGWRYVWQDPFSPEKNPGMWSVGWFKLLRPALAHDSKLMTYSVSSKTRSALTGAGFRVEKIPTTTRKRHWLKATLS